MHNDFEPAVPALVVEFAGEERTVVDRLVFGRNADFALDDNRQMHRRSGEFFFDKGVWWLRNVGSRAQLTIVSSDGQRTDLPPGGLVAISNGQGVIRFNAGITTYEVAFRISGLDVPTARPCVHDGEQTIQHSLALTPREVDLLVAFGQHRLQGREAPLTSYADVAKIWGVAGKTVDNTVQALKRKLRDNGFVRDETLDVLVGLLIRQGLLTMADLEWAQLDTRSPRTSATGPRFSSR